MLKPSIVEWHQQLANLLYKLDPFWPKLRFHSRNPMDMFCENQNAMIAIHIASE